MPPVTPWWVSSVIKWDGLFWTYLQNTILQWNEKQHYYQWHLQGDLPYLIEQKQIEVSLVYHLRNATFHSSCVYLPHLYSPTKLIINHEKLAGPRPGRRLAPDHTELHCIMFWTAFGEARAMDVSLGYDDVFGTEYVALLSLEEIRGHCK